VAKYSGHTAVEAFLDIPKEALLRSKKITESLPFYDRRIASSANAAVERVRFNASLILDLPTSRELV
jgi:hypothetical protein